MYNSILSLCDSYKMSHASQYPKNTVSMYSYMESRGGLYPSTVFVGLQYCLEKYLTIPVTLEELEEVSEMATAHGVPFDYDGWLHIITHHDGLAPVRIKAVREGALVPNHHVLLTIESTDPRVPWIAGFVETLLLKLWYPITVATKSYYVKEMLTKYGSPEWAQFAYHNFGDRGSTSVEAAAIGGFAHLTQFSGTDNFNSLNFCKDHYGADMAGYSVFATEHSTTTSWTKESEEEFVYQQLLDNPSRPIMSFVADSYDVYEFVTFCTKPGSRIRKLVESRPHQKFVFRPDSGEPLEVIGKMLQIMMDSNISMTNNNGRLFTDFGLLWGDGVTPDAIEGILRHFCTLIPSAYGCLFKAENFVFGSGGDLMQNVNRDTQKFAIKCSSITVVDEPTLSLPQHVERDIDVFKDPITDPGKASKRGKVTTYTNAQGGYTQGVIEHVPAGYTCALSTVFLDGKITRTTTLEEIRNETI